MIVPASQRDITGHPSGASYCLPVFHDQGVMAAAVVAFAVARWELILGFFIMIISRGIWSLSTVNVLP